MTMMAPDRGEIAAALVAALNADAVAQNASLNYGQDVFGDGEAPGPATIYPYGFVTHISIGGVVGSDLHLNPDVIQNFEFQITAVGETRQQADDIARLARRTITDMNSTPRGWRVAIAGASSKVIDRTANGSAGTVTSATGLWQAVDRYELLVTTHGAEAQY